MSKPYGGDELIPVTWVKQFHYCPRIVYFLGVLGVQERVTESMAEGKAMHAAEDSREARRLTLGGGRRLRVLRRWRRLWVSSSRLGLVGVIDQVVELEDGLAVVEVKYGSAPRRPPSGHVYQATAYAMLAEETLGKPVRWIILRYLPEGETFIQPITDQMRRHIKWTVRRIKKILEEEQIPRAKPGRKCTGCGWQWICRKT